MVAEIKFLSLLLFSLNNLRRTLEGNNDDNTAFDRAAVDATTFCRCSISSMFGGDSLVYL